MMNDYYDELYDCIQAAKDNKMKLWERICDTDNYNPAESRYITEEEYLLIILKDPDCYYNYTWPIHR